MTEREFSPESAKGATSNSRMGEFVLAMAEDIIPRSPSYSQVAAAYMDYVKAMRNFGDIGDEARVAKDRYDEYLSRMDIGEYGLMMLEYNRLNNISAENNPDQ